MILTLLLSLSVLGLLWFLNKYFINPLKIRHKYSYYSNVVMSRKFSPFTGERYLVKQYEKEKKYRLWYAMQTSLDYPD